jgi:uncharacterized DUF497 family protein
MRSIAERVRADKRGQIDWPASLALCIQYAYNTHTDITWDPRKAAENLRSHDVACADAATVLDDPFAITIADPEHDEQRFITLGADLTGRLLVVVYAYAGAEEIRIISAREASRGERRRYADEPR